MSNDLARTRELITTTNSIGWTYIKGLADETVADLERKAIDEEDDIKGAALRREAKAARKFLNNLLSAVESMRSAMFSGDDAQGDDAQTVEPYFYEVSN